MRQKSAESTFLKSLIISLFAHIIALFAIYFLTQNLTFSNQTQMQKVKLSFKRGGDSAMKNSPHKHNSSIPKSLPAQENVEDFNNQAIFAMQSPARDLAKNPADSAPSPDSAKTPADSAKDSAKNNAKTPADSAPNALNLASLQVHNSTNLSPNNSEQKHKAMANYIASKAIPNDIKAEIFDLYGDELGDYGLAEMDFIINNLRDIGRITQHHINRRGYPQNALIMNKQGKNVVEFYLHPNGDISELRVAKSSNSTILDNDMLTNIKVAFREYPRPTTKVKIRIYMSYRLY